MLVDLKSDVYYYLNGVGTVAWEHLDGSKTGEEIVQVLFEEFDAPLETIRQDVEQLLTDLLAMGLVEEKKI